MTEENSAGLRYAVDLDSAEQQSRSVASLVAARKCYMCKQADADLSVMSSAAEEHMAQIEEDCSTTEDYLLPDTPLKEAAFRVLLAHGNRPMTARQISEDLSGRWTVSPYPRDVSPPVLSRLLESAGGYPIAALPEPSAIAEAPETVPAPPSEETAEGEAAE